MDFKKLFDRKQCSGNNAGRTEEYKTQNQKLATIKKNKSKENMGRNRTSRAQSIIFMSPPIDGLYETQDESKALEEQLLHNIYDATPDHSILKQGLAKSLSTFHLEEVGGGKQRKPSSHPNSAYKRNVNKKMTPRHIMKKKHQAESNRDPHQSLPTLSMRSNSLIEISKKLAETTNFLRDSADSFSESSETESRQDLGLDLSGFEKTQDFGDFVIFSNSPAQV